MAFLNTRDSAELDQTAESEVEGEIREFVRRDVATSLRRPPESDSEIVEYATLSQAALQSTKIIAESLTSWKKVPDAPSLRD